jgi:hypothetical protein
MREKNLVFRRHTQVAVQIGPVHTWVAVYIGNVLVGFGLVHYEYM